MNELSSSEPFSPEAVGALLAGSSGPAFDLEDLALALGDGLTTRHYRVRASAVADLRRAMMNILHIDEDCGIARMRGIVALVRIPVHQPLLRTLREATALLHDVSGEGLNLVIAASRLTTPAPIIELNLWITPGRSVQPAVAGRTD